MNVAWDKIFELAQFAVKNKRNFSLNITVDGDTYIDIDVPLKVVKPVAYEYESLEDDLK